MNNAVGGLIGFVCVVSLAGNFLLYQRYSTAHPLIDVNNQVIRRKDLDDRLDYLYAKSALRNMIAEDVVDQAATQAKVMPTEADVDQEIARVARANPQVITQAKTLDPSLQIFRESVKTRLALRNLQIQGITVSNSEIADYYAQHRNEFRLPPQVKADLATAQDSIAAQAAAQLMKQNDPPSVIAEQPGVKVLGVTAPPVQKLPPSIEQGMLGMKSNSVKLFPIGSQAYLVVHVTKASPAQLPPLADVRPQVEVAARLAKAPTQQQEMAKLMAASHIDAQTSRYADAIPNYNSSDAQQ